MDTESQMKPRRGVSELPQVVRRGTNVQLAELANLAAQPQAVATNLDQLSSTNPPQIIIADDDYLNRLALRTLIKLCNIDALNLTFLAENGLQALEACK